LQSLKLGDRRGLFDRRRRQLRRELIELCPQSGLRLATFASERVKLGTQRVGDRCLLLLLELLLLLGSSGSGSGSDRGGLQCRLVRCAQRCL
jgi:hypothetical protein